MRERGIGMLGREWRSKERSKTRILEDTSLLVGCSLGKVEKEWT